MEELSGIDDENRVIAFKNAMRITFTYKVYTQLGADTNIIETIEDIREAIAGVFQDMQPASLSGVILNVEKVCRRPDYQYHHSRPLTKSESN